MTKLDLLIDFGIQSTSSGQPPPYEQTHNFANYPASHADVDEVIIS